MMNNHKSMFHNRQKNPKNINSLQTINNHHLHPIKFYNLQKLLTQLYNINKPNKSQPKEVVQTKNLKNNQFHLNTKTNKKIFSKITK